MVSLGGNLITIRTPGFAPGRENIVKTEKRFVKILALVLAMMMVVSGGLTALAEGINASAPAGGTFDEAVDENITTNDGSPAVTSHAEEDSTVKLETQDLEANNLDNDTNNAVVDIIADEGSVVDMSLGDVDGNGEEDVAGIDILAENADVTVKAEDVTVQVNNREEGKSYPESTGIKVETEGKKSDVEVTVQDVTADVGVNVNNKGGNVDVETDDIDATKTGVNAYSYPESEDAEDISESEFNSVDLTFADSWSLETDGKGNVIQKEFDMPDGTYYIVTYDENGKITSVKRFKAKGIPGKTTITVDGDVNVQGEFASTGVSLSSQVKGSDASAAITGDVIVKQDSDNPTKQETFYDENGKIIGSWYSTVQGVSESAAQDAASTIDVGGDITVSSNGNAQGAYQYANNGETALTVGGNITTQAGHSASGLSAESRNGGDSSFTVGGSISATQDSSMLSKNDPTKKDPDYKPYYSATGVRVSTSNKSTVEGTVEGSIEAISEGTATGMSINASGDSKVDVTVGEGIYAEGGKDANGLYVNVSGEKTEANVTIENGGIVADGGKDATAIETRIDGGSIDISVTGDVTSSGDGLVIKSQRALGREETERVKIDRKFDPNPEEIIEGGFRTEKDKDGNLITVRTYKHVEGDRVYYYDNLGNAWEEVLTEKGKEVEDTTKIEITGDVTAEEGAIVLDVPYEKSKVDVIVDGTVSGELASVLLDERTDTSNVTLTVWAITENDNGNLAERYKTVFNAEKGDWEKELLGADEEFEQEIQYIIKVEQPEKGTLAAEGTYEYEGYDVAHQGDEITLKVDLPFGYRVRNAYNGTDVKVKLTRNNKGQYFLTVPRGGGVMLSVTLERVPAVITYYPEGGTINGSTDPYVFRSCIAFRPALLEAPVWEGHEFLYWNIQTVKKDDAKWVAPDPASDKQYAPGDLFYLKNEVITATAVWAEK